MWRRHETSEPRHKVILRLTPFHTLVTAPSIVARRSWQTEVGYPLCPRSESTGFGVHGMILWHQWKSWALCGAQQKNPSTSMNVLLLWLKQRLNAWLIKTCLSTHGGERRRRNQDRAYKLARACNVAKHELCWRSIDCICYIHYTNYVHTCIRTNIHTIQFMLCTYIHTCKHLYVYIYIYMYTHTYIHTSIHI